MTMSDVNTTIVTKNAPPAGTAPAIVLINPRFAHNIGMTVRLASCYGLSQVWFTGDRVRLEIEQRGKLPREERMKGYRDVEMLSYERPLEQFKNVVPVAIEVRKDSERLQHFEHPENAVYVFGPEDGSIPDPVLRVCHRFVVIPTRHCLNLATAVSTILWDRAYKRHQRGLDDLMLSGAPDMVSSDTDPSAIGLYDNCPR
jgi:tRNA(Leu) C34 or U34 (ribose-2'-O)-methylase TrmL